MSAIAGESAGAHQNAAWFFLDRHVDEGREGKVAVWSEDATLTYGKLLAQASSFAAALAEAGVGAGDRVAFLMPDSALYVAGVLGTLRAGAVAVPVSTRLALGDYGRIFADCTPALAVVAPEHAETAERLRPELSAPALVWIAAESARAPARALMPLLERRVGAQSPLAAVRALDPAVIQYTSGSTGLPKGVVHLHGALPRIRDCFGKRLGVTETDVCYSPSKLSFAYGFGNTILIPFSVGAASVADPRRPEPARAFEVIARCRPTILFGVPSLYAAMLRFDERNPGADLARLRLCVSAGEPLSRAVFERFRSRFGLEIIDSLGSTEALHVFISATPGTVRAGSLGTAVPGCEIRLVGSEGETLAPPATGELWVKSPCGGAGYFGRDGGLGFMKAGGWIGTGDLLHQDAQGDYFFVGRRDDVIKVAGQKVAPTEIEERFLAHGSVRECAAVAVIKEDGVASIAVFVTLNAGITASAALERELRSFASEGLALHKRPGRVVFAPDLPRTPTGKIDRRRLREQAGETAKSAAP